MDDIKGPGRIKFFWLSFITLAENKKLTEKVFGWAQTQKNWGISLIGPIQ